MPDIQAFINPKPSVTPAVAGALTALVTNTLANQFTVPANWTGLAVSALVALIALKSTEPLTRIERGGYYVLNTLLIFAVALGANTAGVAAQENAGVGFTPSSDLFFRSWF